MRGFTETNDMTTINSCLADYKAHRYSVTYLTKQYLAKIHSADAQYNAFITVCDDYALNLAKELDAEYESRGETIFLEKPLFGIPYACKDNFCTKGVPTTASSRVLENFVPPYESTVTKKLMDAGAVLIGKTNMDAFAHGSSTESSDFFVTKNPHDRKRIPGGSSGGSACAVATDMCVFAIGSETAGSIRCPASWCGVVGYKPSYGRVSRYGVIAMASSLDSPGPIAKTVEDCARVLEVISGRDSKDATSIEKPCQYHPHEEMHIDRGITIGVPISYMNIDLEPSVKERIFSITHLLSQHGIEVTDMDLMDPKYSIAVYTIIQRAEVSSNLARYDGIRFGNTRDAFGFEAKKRMMLGAYTMVGDKKESYIVAQKVRSLIVEDFSRAFEKVDLIVAPTMPCTAPEMGASDRSSMFGELMDVLAEPSSIAGLPAITIPCGFDENKLPIGIQIIGNYGDDKKVFDFGYYLEKLCKSL